MKTVRDDLVICSRCGSSALRDGACLRCGAPVGEGVSPVAVPLISDLALAAPDSGGRPAGFWVRFLGSCLDGLVLWAVTLLVAALGALFAGERLSPIQIAAAGVVFNLFFNSAYFITLHGRTGQTVGKLILGVQVVSAEGRPISYGVASVRWLGYLLSSMTLLIGYLLVAFRRDKRALHDLVAGTRVIYVR